MHSGLVLDVPFVYSYTSHVFGLLLIYLVFHDAFLFGSNSRSSRPILLYFLSIVSLLEVWIGYKGTAQ
jgi:hypothetical protein